MLVPFPLVTAPKPAPPLVDSMGWNAWPAAAETTLPFRAPWADRGTGVLLAHQALW